MSEPKLFGLYVVAAVVSSLCKIRLPGLEGAYSLSFLFVLIGLLRFSLAETLLVEAGGEVPDRALKPE